MKCKGLHGKIAVQNFGIMAGPPHFKSLFGCLGNQEKNLRLYF